MQNLTRFLVHHFIIPSGHMVMGGRYKPYFGYQYNEVFNLMVRDDPKPNGVVGDSIPGCDIFSLLGC